MNKGTARTIVNTVATDPECIRRIDSWLAPLIPDSMGIAGSVRNIGMMGIDLFNPRYGGPTAEETKFVCVGIAEASAAAINSANIAGVVTASDIDRTHLGTYHVATRIDLTSKTVVFDWHANLELYNPRIFYSVMDWKSDNGVLYSDL